MVPEGIVCLLLKDLAPNIALMNSGGILFPTCRIPSSNAPAKRNPSGNDPNLLNSGRENRLCWSQRIAPCMPRLPSLRWIVRAGFLGSNLTGLNPWPVRWHPARPILILLQYLNDLYLVPASRSAASWSAGVSQPASESPQARGAVTGPGCSSKCPPGRRRRSSSAATGGRRNTWRSSAWPRRDSPTPSAPSGSRRISASSRPGPSR